ncbi:MAG: hypothetical protein PVH68_00955 [Armatimonadota bacterium]|jgi:hypothetical protein
MSQAKARGPEAAALKQGQSARAVAATEFVRRGVTWRSMLLGLALMPANCYWVIQMEIVRYSAHPTTISLFFNTVFILLVLALGNLVVRKLFPRAALTQAELLVVYAMLGVASCICGHDGLQVLAPMISWPFRFASPANKWEELFHGHIPPWLSLQEEGIIEGYYLGGTTPYTLELLRAWATPVLLWGGFIVAMLVVMLCLTSILRKQWLEREHLSCPLVYLPVEITRPGGTLFRNKLFWIGFGLTAAIDTWNSFAFLHPTIPRIPIEHQDMRRHFATRPWSAIGWTPVSFYPFVVGVGILMPLDFSFSCWFFYIFWKAERILSAAAGWDQIPDFPYINQQAFGAYMLFCLYAIWLARGYLGGVFRRIVGRPSRLTEHDEPVTYRGAWIGVCVGFVALVSFSTAAGMSVFLAIAFFAIYFALAVAITRMRVQFGSLVHDLHFTGPDTTLTMTLGTKAFSSRDLTVMSLYFWFNRAYRNHPMPHQFEGFKMVERTESSPRKFFWAMVVTAVASTLTAFWGMMHLMYAYGARAKSRSFGPEAFNRLASWMAVPTGPNWGATAGVGVGLAMGLLLETMRMRFVNWPFHPLGFAISGSWEMNLVWLPIMIGWALKLIIIRYGGYRTFTAVVPMFLGMILGQFVVGSILNIVSISLGIPSYMFWQ